jgi:anti-sigma factor RsiW
MKADEVIGRNRRFIMNAHPHGEQLSAYVDGMLDVAQMHGMATHLAICPQCRAAQEALSQTKHWLAGMASPAQPDPRFWADAYRRMRVESTERPRLTPRGTWDRVRTAFQDPHRRWSTGLAAAAVIVGAILVPFMNEPGIGIKTTTTQIVTTAPDSVDVSMLMQAHTESAARQPLADTDRQDVMALDNSFSADDAALSPLDASDAGSDASSP